MLKDQLHGLCYALLISGILLTITALLVIEKQLVGNVLPYTIASAILGGIGLAVLRKLPKAS